MRGSAGARGQTAACVVQIAFLAAMVGPKVAAAAAQRALEVLTEDDPDLAAAADTVMDDDGEATAGSNGLATGVHFCLWTPLDPCPQERDLCDSC